jgi:transcriptional regulator with XRE-family HTH domain
MGGVDAGCVPTPRVRFDSRAHDLAARFSRELVAARAVAGLAQRQVARRAGVSQSLVSLVETGRTMPSLDLMHRLAAATGHDLSIRLFPGRGVRLRDSGQLAVADQIRAATHASWRIRLEMPVGPPPDRRAVDMVLETTAELVVVEVERALLDFQAQFRAAQLKRAAIAERDSRSVRLVMAVPDTRRNRAVINAHRSMLETALPTPSRKIWASLRSGSPACGDGLLWVRRGR